MDPDAQQPTPEPSEATALENPDASAESLETLETVETSASASSNSGPTIVDATKSSGDSQPSAPAPKPVHGLKKLMRVLNIYLLLFVFILVIAGVIIGVAYFQSKKQSSSGVVQSQNLSQKTLEQLASSDAQVGDAKQVLNVQSNAIFAGKVLVRDSLEVAGSIQVGGTVTLTNLNVTGATNFEQTQVSKNLSVGGDAAIQGSVTVQRSLQVNGGGTFNGPVAAPQITTSVFQLNGDLTLTHHIIAGGPSPSRSNGPALGSGGSSSVSGSDTSGTLNVNTGGGTGNGCFATISFAQRYNGTPHVIVTPVGADAGALDYYVTRTSSSFSICDASAPPSGVSFSFDYFVVD